MKSIFVSLFLFIFFSINSQNVQLHYDFGRLEDGTKRDYFVSTFELFKPDSLGYTFLFTDFEFNSPDKPRGVSLGYFEISHEFNIPWFTGLPVLQHTGIHLEYNDGSLIYAIDDSTVSGENVRSSWLVGVEYSQQFGDLSLNLMCLYKYLRGSEAPDFQWTIVWFYPLFKNKISLSGYADVWTQKDFTVTDKNKQVILYSEPQVWFNFTEHLSIGSEFKISKNFFPGSKRVEVFPTLGVKWEF
jgi:hypothetical protein